MVDFGLQSSHGCRVEGGLPMADRFKLPRALSEEPNAPKPLRPSHQKIIENLERWANSRELQPPKLPDDEAN
jgi:hypothetical protein